MAVAAAVCAGLAVAGGWWWLRALEGGDLHVAAGTVQADLLVPDEVSRLAGTTLVAGPRGSEPPEAVAVAPAGCAVAAGPATRSVYGHEWTAFLSATYQDAAGAGDHTVTQVIGVYPDEGKASAAFRRLDEGLRGCPAAVRTDPDGSASTWSYRTDTVTPDTIGWTATQDAGDGWACHRQARLKGRTVLQVALCSAGDGRPAVARIADRIAGQVTA
ncbi:sensor domain-containing protein [Kitasatospora sp. NPDC057542]|uniref:sensor domain-containing protein n=1 Tax=Kitasatospora sp. NPDC057542 TaxID=3346162 RepID=UPI0036BB307B